MKNISVKLNDEMQNMLDLILDSFIEVNKGYKLTKSDILRILILEKYAEIIGQNNGL